MQREITMRVRGWIVETMDAGTCALPGSVVPVPDWLADGHPIEERDASDSELFAILAARVRDFIEGRRILSIEAATGYFARLTAPGYLDCTAWTAHRTVREAQRALARLEAY